MKKYLKIAFIYAIVALACGVFYREFTKFNEFTGKTTLAFNHLHFFVLGTIIYLLIAIFSQITNIQEVKQFKVFTYTYNIGLIFLNVMFMVRGIIQVLEINLSNSTSMMISGFAGIAHIVITVGIVTLFVSLLKSKSVFEKK